MLQNTLFSEPVRAPADIPMAAREFADKLYDWDGQLTRDALSFRIELYTREVLAQFGVK